MKLNALYELSSRSPPARDIAPPGFQTFHALPECLISTLLRCRAEND